MNLFSLSRSVLITALSVVATVSASQVAHAQDESAGLFPQQPATTPIPVPAPSNTPRPLPPLPTNPRPLPPLPTNPRPLPPLPTQPAPPRAGNGVCLAQLGGAIDRTIAQLPGARWSVLVQTQGAAGVRRNIYDRNGSTLMVPASNNKVFTTAAALKKLGSQFRLTTPVLGNTTGPDLDTLRVIGQGDPSLHGRQLASLIQQLKQRGIRQTKLLIGDDTVFRGEPFNPNWDEEDRGQGYAAPVNSLMLNENNIYTGAVPNAGNYFVGEFRTGLNKAGIKVIASTLVKRTPAPQGEISLASITSPPLSSLIYETNQESNNIYAEALMKTLGRLQEPNSFNTTVSGVNAVKAVLTEMGVNPSRYTMVDGSGLAVSNRASAEALVQTLQAVAMIPEAAIYKRSLPIAGVSGTLENRFRGTSAQGIVFAKTGTISGVVSLSGYITPRNYSPMVFSIIVNSSYGASSVRPSVDQIVGLLSRLQSGC